MTRPNFIEAEAIQHAITWAEVTGGRLYIVHMLTAEGADLVKAAQGRGVNVYAETCAQYLVLDDSAFEGPDGHLFACCPQVKKKKDEERLWRGLHDGEVSVISTDTCTFSRAQKARWEGDWTKIPMGLPGLETLLPIVYTHGVLEGRLTTAEFVAKCCTNPAKLMGLYPAEGHRRRERRRPRDHRSPEADRSRSSNDGDQRRLEPLPGLVARRLRRDDLFSRPEDRSPTTNSSAKAAGGVGCPANEPDRSFETYRQTVDRTARPGCRKDS